jgi:hypothetical protein
VGEGVGGHGVAVAAVEVVAAVGAAAVVGDVVAATAPVVAVAMVVAAAGAVTVRLEKGPSSSKTSSRSTGWRKS